MPVLRVNPEAEVKSDFPTMRPGVYRMRVDEVLDLPRRVFGR